jgi:UDP-N-acetylmuramate--alanine ligase
VALFQPHLFSRTRDFTDDFGTALAAADVNIVMDVYPSRERPIPGVTGELVAEAARRAGHAKTIYTHEKARVVDCLEQTLQAGDLLVTLGAGDVVKFGEEYLRRGRG